MRLGRNLLEGYFMLLCFRVGPHDKHLPNTKSCFVLNKSISNTEKATLKKQRQTGPYHLTTKVNTKNQRLRSVVHKKLRIYKIPSTAASTGCQIGLPGYPALEVGSQTRL